MGGSPDAGRAVADSLDDARTIGRVLASHAATRGAAIAFVGCGSPGVTFAQLFAGIRSAAARLAHAGLRREDRVGLLVPAGAYAGQLVVALASNITLVPVNPALTPHELIEFTSVSGLKAFVIPGSLEAPARSAIFDQGLIVFEAVPAADGVPALELVTLSPEAGAPLRPARSDDAALLLRSSGTTGAPKLIPVTHGNLLAMADKLGCDLWFKLTADDRAACTLPLYYAAGLKTSLFVPLLLGGSVAFPPAGQALDIGKWFDLLEPTYLSVAPGSLNGILDGLRARAGGFAGRSLRFVMCAAAYLPEDTRVAAQALLRVPVLEFYGLSEAGVMAANPVPPGMVKPGTVGLPAPGELLVVDEDRQPLANGTLGQIMISGPTVTPGYVMTDHSRPGELTGGWLLTGDLGRIDEDGYLTIVGRVAEVINQGGEKVFPYEIEKAILAHPAVLEAAAFAVPHPRLGEKVAAAVVVKPGSTVSPQELKDFLAARLASFKLPRRLNFVSSLPRGATGKISRSSLREAYAAWRPEMVVPDQLAEWELRLLWQRLLGTDDIGIDDDFFEKGGDSLLATQMLIEVEDMVGRPYPQSELSTLTIRRMSEVLACDLSGERDLITQVKAGAGIPLFFCHGDYVTRGIYARKLAALLPDDQPLYLLHCYGEGSAGSSIEEMANAYVQEVIRAAAGSPVFVGGYCNGGLTAWHLAHLLRSKGVPVVELLLVEAMSLNGRASLRHLPRLLHIAGSIVPGRAGKFLREQAMRGVWNSRRRSARLTYQAARNKISLALRPRPAPQVQRAAFGPQDVAFLGLMSRYVPPRADFPLTCFIAEEGWHFDTDPSAWRKLAPSVQEVRVPGTHHTAVVSQRQALAAALGKAMALATARYVTQSSTSLCRGPARQ